MLRRGIIVVVITAAALLAISAATSLYAADRNDTIAVLMYHHLGYEDEGATLAPERFAEQMAWLAGEGYYTATMDELLRFLQGELDLPPKTVVITFDDGYLSNYEIAYPVLRKHGLRAAFFPVGASRGKTPGKYRHYSWEQAREMTASGYVEIHSHSYDMHYYSKDGTPALLAAAESERMVDLLLSRMQIVDQVGVNPVAIAYPYGAVDEKVLASVRRAGFQLGFTVEPGCVSRGADPLLLPRLNVAGGMELDEFAQTVMACR